MAYLKSQRREFEKNRSDSSQILVAEQALSKSPSTFWLHPVRNWLAILGVAEMGMVCVRDKGKKDDRTPWNPC